MSFLLNLDTVCALFRRQRLVVNLAQQHRGQLSFAAPAVTFLELWLTHQRTPSRYLPFYQQVMPLMRVVSLDEPIAHRAATLSRAMGRSQPKMSLMALFVAATALENNLTLVTNATQYFGRIPGLLVVNWMVP